MIFLINWLKRPYTLRMYTHMIWVDCNVYKMCVCVHVCVCLYTICVTCVMGVYVHMSICIQMYRCRCVDVCIDYDAFICVQMQMCTQYVYNIYIPAKPLSRRRFKCQSHVGNFLLVQGKAHFLYVEGKNMFSLLPPMNRATLILCGRRAVLQFCYKDKFHFCEQAQDFNWWLFWG